jgi:hypothetical protein
MKGEHHWIKAYSLCRGLLLAHQASVDMDSSHPPLLTSVGHLRSDNQKRLTNGPKCYPVIKGCQAVLIDWL